MIFEVNKSIRNDIYFTSKKSRATISDINYVVMAVNKKSGKLEVPDEAPLIGCKDYINDTIANYLFSGTNCYRSTGSYAGAEYKLPTDGSYVLVRSTCVDRIEEGIKKYINPVEKRAGLVPTEVIPTDHPYCIVLKGDKVLFKDMVLANLWIMLWRIMWYSDRYKDLATLEEVIVSHAEKGLKDSDYLRIILLYCTPSFAEQFLSIAKKFVLTKKEYRKVLKDKRVHASGGIKNTISELGSYKAGISSALTLVIAGRPKLLLDSLPWKPF